jgi:hypothetical protein
MSLGDVRGSFPSKPVARKLFGAKGRGFRHFGCDEFTAWSALTATVCAHREVRGRDPAALVSQQLRFIAQPRSLQRRRGGVCRLRGSGCFAASPLSEKADVESARAEG